ncbi:MAG: nuclear transport factor 2 family protein [Sporocytophaga sp.]|nr:nuclear transport factor 2 family protein [Sporocytophaga sp.]
MDARTQIIKDYIKAYNAFDTDNMIRDFDEMILFENVQNGKVNLSIRGLEAFKRQADQAKDYFEKRQQTIRSVQHDINVSEIEVDYYAVLAMDFPNGLKKGEELKLQGKSIFEFNENNKVIKLTDLS